MAAILLVCGKLWLAPAWGIGREKYSAGNAGDLTLLQTSECTVHGRNAQGCVWHNISSVAMYIYNSGLRPLLKEFPFASCVLNSHRGERIERTCLASSLFPVAGFRLWWSAENASWKYQTTTTSIPSYLFWCFISYCTELQQMRVIAKCIITQAVRSLLRSTVYFYGPLYFTWQPALALQCLLTFAHGKMKVMFWSISDHLLSVRAGEFPYMYSTCVVIP